MFSHLLPRQLTGFHFNSSVSILKTKNIIKMSTSTSIKSSSRVTKFSQLIESSKLPFYSIEIFPPSSKSLNDLKNLLSDLRKYRPLFCAITSKSTSRTSNTESLSRFDLARLIITNYGFDILLHVTCSDLMDSDQGRKFLQEAKNCGIKYIFALRGDDLDESTEREFNHAIDIVRFIRAEFPNDFVVAVAGYPNGHPSVSSLAEDVKYLKAKVDAGADLIISQFFFNVDVFAQWVRLCRSADIKAPILPGIFTFPSYRSFTRMMKTTQVPICNQLESKIENISNCDQQIKQFAIEQSTQLCLNLVNQGLCPGLHFFSLNKDSTLQVIEMIEPKIPRTTINQQLLRLSAQLEEFTLDSGSETLEKNQPSVKSGDKTPESSNYHQN